MQHYNLTESAKYLHCPLPCLCWAIHHSLIPLPDIHLGKRSFYSPHRLRKVAAKLTIVESGYSIKEAAEYLGLGYSTLRHKLDAGVVQYPQGKVGKRLKFSKAELDALLADDSWRKKRKTKSHEGYYNCCQAAEWLGMPRITLQSWIAKGRVAPPKHGYIGVSWRLYSVSDLENIVENNPEYFRGRIIPKISS